MTKQYIQLHQYPIQGQVKTISKLNNKVHNFFIFTNVTLIFFQMSELITYKMLIELWKSQECSDISLDIQQN